MSESEGRSLEGWRCRSRFGSCDLHRQRCSHQRCRCTSFPTGFGLRLSSLWRQEAEEGLLRSLQKEVFVRDGLRVLVSYRVFRLEIFHQFTWRAIQL